MPRSLHGSRVVVTSPFNLMEHRMKKAGFGTDGWRGVIAEEFTFGNLRLVAQAIMSYIKWHGMKGSVVIGYDTRFMSEDYADVVASVVAGNGLTAVLSECAITTPMLSYAAARAQGCGGIMVTASHNPCRFNGIKYKAAFGGSAYPSMTREIEYLIGRDPILTVPLQEDGGANIKKTDFFGPYITELRGLLDDEILGSSGFKVLLDCMHGAGGGVAGRVCEGLGVEMDTMRTARDPYFGGSDPEPSEHNLRELSQRVREGGYDIGFALDGDADRLGVVDGEGSFVTAHQVLSLLLLHMHKNRRQTGMVVKTVSTSSVVDKVAAKLGLPVVETPVGFKHICELMLKEDVLIGGEENGGLGIKGYIPERDGLLAGLLLMEMMIKEQKTIRELLDWLDAKFGKMYYKRQDVPVTDGVGAAFDGLKDGIGKIFGEFGIAEVRETDGVKAVFTDGSWILFRSSGTEPLIRVYAESGDAARTDQLIARGVEALDVQGIDRG